MDPQDKMLNFSVSTICTATAILAEVMKRFGIVYNNANLEGICKGYTSLDYKTYDLSNKSFEDLKEDLFALLTDGIDLDSRKKSGSERTPNDIINYMLDLIEYRGEHILRKNITDPACGTGTFVAQIVDRIIDATDEREKSGLIGKFIEDKCVMAYDTKPSNVFVTKVVIIAVLINRGCITQIKDVENLIQNLPVYCSDYLTVHDKSDYVIGNPPYINVENLDVNLKEYLFKHYKTCIGRTDIYIGFIEKSLSIMAEKGSTTYIIPFSYTNQNYAESSRSLLVNNYSIDELLDTSNYLVFKNAMVKNITIRISKCKSSLTVINVVYSENDFVNKNFNQSIVDTSQFNLLKGCRLETRGSIELIGIKNRIESCSFKLGSIFTIAYGVRVNSKTDKTKPKSYYVHSEYQPLYKPFTEGKCIQRYRHVQCGWLNYKPSEHYNAMYPELFENEKIITINVVSDRLRFSYDNEHLYNSHTVMNCVNIKYLTNAKHISAKKAIEEGNLHLARQYSTLFVLGVLNSKLTSWYFKKFQSEGLHFYPDDAKNLRIPYATQEQQQKVQFLVQKLMNEKESDLDEMHIDEIVYHLFNLSYNDIKIIDPNFQISREEYEKGQ